MYDKLRWSMLTADQQARFGNGCGPRWLPRKMKVLMFGWFFEASCRHHDFGYAIGGHEINRWKCDLRFLDAMLEDAAGCHGRQKVAAYILSWVFYFAVAIAGPVFFDYGSKKRTIEEVIKRDEDLK